MSCPLGLVDCNSHQPMARECCSPKLMEGTMLTTLLKDRPHRSFAPYCTRLACLEPSSVFMTVGRYGSGLVERSAS